MIEIRIHGRGGQGNVVAAYILAAAAIEQGYFAQAFPNFGAERRGAPVAAFVRIAREPVMRRSQVLHPHYLIVQDRALLHVPGVTDGLMADGGILVNTSKRADELVCMLENDIVTLPAGQIAVRHLGRPLPNTALLAAFTALTGLVSSDALEQALRQRLQGKGDKVLQANLDLVREVTASVSANKWRREGYATNA